MSKWASKNNHNRKPIYFKQIILGYLISFIYRIYASTFRYSVNFDDESDTKLFFNSLTEKQPPLIYAFFHQLELGLIPYFINSGVSILVSPSKDGQILATVLHEYGLKTIRGSSSKKPIASVIKCIDTVRKGGSLALAADGPRGPAFKIKEGAVKISQKTNTPIIPISAKIQKYKLLPKTWDQTAIPYPFSKIEIQIGKIKIYQTTTELEQLLDKRKITL